MDNIMLLTNSMPSGFWESILGWFEGFITNYGWTIIIFTICLKLLLSPLDFYQKLSMRKTQRQQALLKPELDKIKQKYGDNKQIIQEKTMELYKKNKISPAGGCLPMLIYMIVTTVTFLTLFGAMNNISQFKIQNEYVNLQQVYVESYVEFKDDYLTGIGTINIDGLEYNYSALREKAVEVSSEYLVDGKYVVGEVTYDTLEEFVDAFVDSALKVNAQDKVLQHFTANKTSFLWIKNIFRPDNYSSSFPNYDEFVKSVSNLYSTKVNTENEREYYYFSQLDSSVGENGYFYLTEDPEQNKLVLESAKTQGKLDFNEITTGIRTQYSSWNGYFILIILAALSSLLGQLFATAGAKVKTKEGEEKIKRSSNKIMLIVMPLIMVWFTWGYSSAFGLYIVTSGFATILISYLINLIINKVDGKLQQKELATVTISSQSKTKKTNTNNIAKEDYRIEKKGKIFVEKKSDDDKGDKK